MTAETPQKSLCPKCREVLSKDDREGIEVQGCTTCKGVWVDYASQRQLLKSKMEPFTLEEVRRLRDQFKPLGRIEEIKYCPCPVCG